MFCCDFTTNFRSFATPTFLGLSKKCKSILSSILRFFLYYKLKCPLQPSRCPHVPLSSIELILRHLSYFIAYCWFSLFRSFQNLNWLIFLLHSILSLLPSSSPSPTIGHRALTWPPWFFVSKWKSETTCWGAWQALNDKTFKINLK